MGLGGGGGESDAVFAAIGVVEEEGVVLNGVGSGAGLGGEGEGEVGFDAQEVEGAVVVEAAIGGDGDGGIFSACLGEAIGAVETEVVDGREADEGVVGFIGGEDEVVAFGGDGDVAEDHFERALAVGEGLRS